MPGLSHGQQGYKVGYSSMHLLSATKQAAAKDCNRYLDISKHDVTVWAFELLVRPKALPVRADLMTTKIHLVRVH